MEWTKEQQTEIDRLVEEAKTEATKGLFTKEQLNTEVGKAKEGLFTKEQLDNTVKTETQKYHNEKVKPLEDELTKYKPKEKSDAEKLLEQKESELKVYKTKEKLAENNLSGKLHKFVFGEGEELENNIKELKEICDEMYLDDSFKGSSHKKTPKGITKEQFSKMGYFEKLELSEKNPTLYEQLSKQ